LATGEASDEDDMAVRETISFNRFWGWFGTLVSLADEGITKIEEITKYPLIFVLNYLSYQKDIGEIRAREQQRASMTNKYK